jgi:hypothetical protein
MPLINAANKTWGPKGVIFIEVSLDGRDRRADTPKFMEATGSDLPVWVGASADDLQKLRLGDGIPDTAFIDRRGVIISRVLGEIRRSELDERLAWLTGDQSDPRPEPVVNHMPSLR